MKNIILNNKYILKLSIAFFTIIIYIISINSSFKNFNYLSFTDNCVKQYKNIQKIFHNYKDNNNNIKTIINKKNISLVKVALCVVAKQENIYIKEYVDYYLNLGIKKIFLYDNNELEGENFEEILENEINIGLIEIINFRGLYKPQKRAYNECYINNKFNFDWIAFFDVDEYLYLENFININNYLSLSKFKKCSSILFNWRNYGDNNNIYYNPKPIVNRFIIPFYYKRNFNYDKYIYSAAKSIVKGGLNITWKHFPHFLNNSNICRPNGDIISEPLSPPFYSSAYLKHYATKSTEEYIIKLFKGTVNSKFTLNKETIIFWIKNYYFLFNKITKKKINIF